MMIYDSYIINPPDHLKPSYRISPFNEKDIHINKKFKNDNSFDEYIENRFKDKNFIYTIDGRSAIAAALDTLKLSPVDEVAIFTTTDNLYISSCVTSEIEKYCKWSRDINKKTKAILVNHEFGFCYKKLKKLKQYNLPIIEDFAHSFNSKNNLIVGDFLIFSLSKYFPTQVGGMLVFDTNHVVKDKLCAKIKSYMKNIFSYYQNQIDEISKNRILNYRYMTKLFKQINIEPYFKIENGDVPSVFMFKTYIIKDLSKFKVYVNSQGIESSIFYGENAFFIPCHQNLNREDMNYFYGVIEYYINNQGEQ